MENFKQGLELREKFEKNTIEVNIFNSIYNF